MQYRNERCAQSPLSPASRFRWPFPVFRSLLAASRFINRRRTQANTRLPVESIPPPADAPILWPADAPAGNP